MNWQEKFVAICTISKSSLVARGLEDWLVHDEVEIGGDGFLTSKTQLNCHTPEEAVQVWWRQHVEELPPGRFLVVKQNGSRKHFRWNDFMWKELEQ